MEKLELLRSRRSVRTYSTEPVSQDIVNKLKAEVTFINTHENGLKFQLFFNDDNPFKGFFKSYGTFVNPRNYLAAIVDTGVPHILEKSGYFAEKFVIKAVELGLGTCFVAGTYDVNSINAQLRAGEKILFVVLFGNTIKKDRLSEKMLVKLVHRKKMTPEDFFEPKSDYEIALSQFPDLSEGIEAVACAPSSLNKRPTRLFIRTIDDRKHLCARVDDSNQKNLIDLGIAKFNFNFATDSQCEWGNGAPLNSADSDMM